MIVPFVLTPEKVFSISLWLETPALNQGRIPARQLADLSHAPLLKVEQPNNETILDFELAKQFVHQFRAASASLAAPHPRSSGPDRALRPPSRTDPPIDTPAGASARAAGRCSRHRDPRHPMAESHRPLVLIKPGEHFQKNLLRQISSATRRGRCERTMRMTSGTGVRPIPGRPPGRARARVRGTRAGQTLRQPWRWIATVRHA